MKKVSHKGVLQVRVTLTCGCCGCSFDHQVATDLSKDLPEVLKREVDAGGWRKTRKYGWVCSCQEAVKKLRRLHASSAKRAARHNGRAHP